MTDNNDDRRETGKIGEKFSEERVRRRLPDGLTDQQKEILTATIRNPNAGLTAVSRISGSDASTVSNAVQSLLRGGYESENGYTQTTDRRGNNREAKTYDELTDKQRVVIDFVAENYEWVHSDDVTSSVVSDAIQDQHDTHVHPTYWPQVLEKYPEIFERRREKAFSDAGETPDVEQMGWKEMIDAIQLEMPDKNLDDVTDAVTRDGFAANSAATEEGTNEPMETKEPDDVALEMDENDEQQLEEGTSTSVPDIVRDESADPFERADALVEDLNRRVAFVEDLDEPGKAALRFQDYFQVTRSVVGSLRERIDESESVMKDLRKRAQQAEGKTGELTRVTKTQAERIDELNSVVMEAEEQVEKERNKRGKTEQRNNELQKEVERLEEENQEQALEIQQAEVSPGLQALEERNESLCERIDELAEERDNLRRALDRAHTSDADDEKPSVPLANINDPELRNILLMIAQYVETRELEGYEVSHGDGFGATVKIDFGRKGDDE